MLILLAVLAVIIAVLSLLALALSLRIVQQYEEGVLFRLGRVVGQKKPGLTWIVPIIDVLRRVSLRIVTMPIQSQGIITRDVKLRANSARMAVMCASRGPLPLCCWWVLH